MKIYNHLSFNKTFLDDSVILRIFSKTDKCLEKTKLGKDTLGLKQAIF